MLEMFVRSGDLPRESRRACVERDGSAARQRHSAQARRSALELPRALRRADRAAQSHAVLPTVCARRWSKRSGTGAWSAWRTSIWIVSKPINDTLGHEIGDALLNTVAQRLCECVRSGDTVARLSSDEFTLIFSDMRNADDAARIATKILEAFGRAFHVAAQEIYVNASVGIALFPLDDRTADGLMRDADIAMCRAKESGGNSYQFYHTEMTYRVAEKMAMENGLRRAIERKELRLNYQTKIDLRRHRRDRRGSAGALAARASASDPARTSSCRSPRRSD